MIVKELRRLTGLSQSKFASYFGIPVRTLQEWEQERKSPPDYVIAMMERALVCAQGRADKLHSIIKESPNNCDYCVHALKDERLSACVANDCDCIACRAADCTCKTCEKGSSFVWNKHATPTHEVAAYA